MFKLLDLGADITAINEKGRHALHLTLDNPSFEKDTILQFLEREDSKSLLRIPDNAGFTPLHRASWLFSPAVGDSMIAKGADLLAADPNGDTALHHIFVQCLKLRQMVPRGTGSMDLGTEYTNGFKRLWQRFLDLGFNINACNNKSELPLFIYLASPQRDDYRPEPGANCHTDDFELFFEAADILLRNINVETALHMIAIREISYYTTPEHDAKLFRLIMGKVLDPLAEDVKNRSTLDVAAACEKSAISELFQHRAST